MSITIEPGLAVNVPLLRKTLEHLTAHPEEHIQANWATRNLDTACGTAFCLAGHAVQFAGYEIAWDHRDGDVSIHMDNVAYHVDTVGHETIEEVATSELGLDYCQARNLFDYNNSRERLWYLANEITNGEIEIPAEYL